MWYWSIKGFTPSLSKGVGVKYSFKVISFGEDLGEALNNSVIFG